MQGNTRLTKTRRLSVIISALLLLSSCGGISDEKEVVLTRSESSPAVGGISDPHSGSLSLFGKGSSSSVLQKNTHYGIAFSTEGSLTGLELSAFGSNGYVSVELYSYGGDYSESVLSEPLIRDWIYVEENGEVHGVYFSASVKSKSGRYLLVFVTQNDGLTAAVATKPDNNTGNIVYYANGEKTDTSFAFTVMLHD